MNSESILLNKLDDPKTLRRMNLEKTQRGVENM